MVSSAEHSPVQGSEARLRVLVVSDDQGLREQLLVNGLRRRGFAVESLATAAELYRQLFRQTYDLILIDTVLPDENGYSAAARLRCVKRVGVEMLSTLFDLFGKGDDDAPRRSIDLDRVAQHLRAIAALCEEQPDMEGISWRHADTTAQVMRSAS